MAKTTRIAIPRNQLRALGVFAAGNDFREGYCVGVRFEYDAAAKSATAVSTNGHAVLVIRDLAAGSEFPSFTLPVEAVPKKGTQDHHVTIDATVEADTVTTVRFVDGAVDRDYRVDEKYPYPDWQRVVPPADRKTAGRPSTAITHVMLENIAKVGKHLGMRANSAVSWAFGQDTSASILVTFKHFHCLENVRMVVMPCRD